MAKILKNIIGKVLLGKLLGHGLKCPGFKFHQKQEIFLISRMSRPTLGPIQPPI